MSEKIKTRGNCRVCGADMESVLNLGGIMPSDFTPDESSPQPVPLDLCRCNGCGLIQLRHTVDPELLYRKYWYRSALNESMKAALKSVVDSATSRIRLFTDDTVLDIGCNDGTLLSFYDQGIRRIGFDPANNLALSAGAHCEHFCNDFFSAEEYVLLGCHPARVVTTIAMFYDLENPNQFVADVKKVMAEDGLWVIQFTDLISMMTANAFDNICHEHLEYYSINTLDYLLNAHGLEIFDVETNGVNGGSIRAFVNRVGERKISENVSRRRALESDYLSTPNPFSEFAMRIVDIKSRITDFIHSKSVAGKKILAMGASTKGNTLLQYFGINSDTIPFAAEVNADKFGLKTVGTGLKIISEESAFAMRPDYFLVLPWHFIDTFISRNQDYMLAGGKFIVPMPVAGVWSLSGFKPL